MIHYVICELNNRVVLAAREGDTLMWANKQLAHDFMLQVSVHNSGVFFIEEWSKLDRRYRWMNAILKRGSFVIDHYRGEVR